MLDLRASLSARCLQCLPLSKCVEALSVQVLTPSTFFSEEGRVTLVSLSGSSHLLVLQSRFYESSSLIHPVSFPVSGQDILYLSVLGLVSTEDVGE